uniref:F-box domain-containing protein n=1 Tax=Panagrolaimus sp. ES5 TaxID=591445 RepID=A0AC34F784_9BILA
MSLNFSLPHDVMKHILATEKSDVVAKLYKTCKYFPTKFNLLLVDGLRHTFRHDVLVYGDETLNVDPEAVGTHKNLWVIHQLISVTNDPRLSTWISNISRCTIHHLEIRARNLNMNEYEILTNSGTIEHLEINKVYNDNLTRVPLEVLLSRVPKASFIIVEYTHVTSSTMKILAESSRENKITNMSLRNIDDMLDDEDYYQFMRKYAEKEAQFYVQFEGISEERAKKFGTSIKFKNFISKEANPKPHFSYSL